MGDLLSLSLPTTTTPPLPLSPPTHGGQRMGGGDLIPVWRGAAHEVEVAGSVSSSTTNLPPPAPAGRHRPAFQSPPVGQQLLSRQVGVRDEAAVNQRRQHAVVPAAAHGGRGGVRGGGGGGGGGEGGGGHSREGGEGRPTSSFKTPEEAWQWCRVQLLPLR